MISQDMRFYWLAGYVIPIVLAMVIVTSSAAGSDTGVGLNRIPAADALAIRPVVVTVTPLPCPTSSGYSCMEESQAQSAWGDGGYEQFSSHPCGYTSAGTWKYCYRQGLAVAAVTTTSGIRIADSDMQARRYEPDTGSGNIGQRLVSPGSRYDREVVAARGANSSEGPWISGIVSPGVFTCSGSSGNARFYGSAGNADNMVVTLKIFDVPYNPEKTLPEEGVTIGSATIIDGVFWEYLWDGTVPGYKLVNNQDYYVKLMLSDSNYTKVGLRYECPNEGPFISGIVSPGVFTCSGSSGKVRFYGSAGNADNRVITLKIFDVPYSPVKNLPADGVDIGSTTIKDSFWEYNWDRNVPGYPLTPNQEYYVKAKLTDTNFLNFGIRYECSEEGPFISGIYSNYNITCRKPFENITFYGSGSEKAEGMPVTMKIFDIPGSQYQVLPQNGVVIGTTSVLQGGYWGYAWNGNVPGHLLVMDQDYLVKAMISDTNYLNFGIHYECTNGSILVPLPAWSAPTQPVPPQEARPDSAATMAGGSGAGASASGDQPSTTGTPFSILQPVFDFFNSIFGRGPGTSDTGRGTWLNPQPEPP